MAILTKRVALMVKCTECDDHFELHSHGVKLQSGTVSIVCPACHTEYLLEHVGGEESPKGGKG